MVTPYFYRGYLIAQNRDKFEIRDLSALLNPEDILYTGISKEDSEDWIDDTEYRDQI